MQPGVRGSGSSGTGSDGRELSARMSRRGAVPGQLEQRRMQVGVRVRRSEEIARSSSSRWRARQSCKRAMPSSSIRSAVSLTASPSRTARACRISTASSSETCRTHAPRCGSRTTRPSSSSRMSAVRTAPRDMSNVVLTSASTRRAFGACHRGRWRRGGRRSSSWTP